MKLLLGEGIPEGWNTFAENAFYLCPNCDNVIASETLRIDDGSGNWLVHHVKPNACPKCGEELVFWDDKVPMGELDLAARCDGFAENGCLKCGSTNVSITAGNWD